MQAPVLNAANEEVGTRELKDDVFGIDVNEALLWEMVRMQEARRRQGTHKVKTRGEVSGSGKKLWRQKGTGRARVGTKKSPVWRGGGIVFGPTPRNYYYSMPKKKRRAALRSALAGKLRDGELLVVESFGLTEIKTKTLAGVLEKLGAQNALIVTTGADEFVDLSARNIPSVKVIRCEGLNVYDILRYDKLVFIGDALDKIQGGL
ncbi:MAG: 50S ribosomal protein L4 [Deltaproteobacteria bacterium]|nr:MAG: 50S ribosomal protein L4 [Deltaproteobacteria bacterium]